MNNSKQTNEKRTPKHGKVEEKPRKTTRTTRSKTTSSRPTIDIPVSTNKKVASEQKKTAYEKEIERERMEERAKKVKPKRRVLKTVVTILLILIVLAFSFLGYKIQKNGGGLSGLLATLLGQDESTLANLEPIQILVMGESGVDSYKLADTIMVASYNPKTQSASLMSIPRDTYVGKKNRKTATQQYIASYKINTVFRSGTNIPEAIDRINDVTGMDLSNYLIIDTKALIKLVDAIGGVTFDVPINMWYNDDSQNLHINLNAGEQLIDGPKAEQLLRFRHNDDGSTYPSSYGQQDLGRMKTQRNFITATLKQTLKPQNVFKIKQIMDIMSTDVTTNLDISKLKQYVPYAVKFNADNLKTGVVPGDVEMCNGVSIYVANETKTKELVDELFNDLSEEELEKNSAIKVEVLNGSGKTSNLETVVGKLKAKGYTITKQDTTTVRNKTTIYNRTSQSSDIISKIKKILGTATTSSEKSASGADITIIIGKDY